MQTHNTIDDASYQVSNSDFMLNVKLIHETLKTCNKHLLYEVDQLFSTLMNPPYFMAVLSLASHQLAETDAEAYQCFLQHGYQDRYHPNV